jgi:hypothetical protein
VITTNDNVDALRFYQRRGFRLAALHRGAVDDSRARLKPEIPEIGEYGIPLRDELELDLELRRDSPATCAARPCSRRVVGGRGDWLQLRQEVAQLGELARSELPFPVGLDLEHDFADRFDRGAPSRREADAPGALVAVIASAAEVSEPLELPEQVVQRLFGHARLDGELGRSLVLGPGVLQDVQVRGHQIGVAALVQAGEHPVADGLERQPQQRADQRRRQHAGLSKVT